MGSCISKAATGIPHDTTSPHGARGRGRPSRVRGSGRATRPQASSSRANASDAIRESGGTGLYSSSALPRTTHTPRPSAPRRGLARAAATTCRPFELGDPLGPRAAARLESICRAHGYPRSFTDMVVACAGQAAASSAKRLEVAITGEAIPVGFPPPEVDFSRVKEWRLTDCDLRSFNWKAVSHAESLDCSGSRHAHIAGDFRNLKRLEVDGVQDLQLSAMTAPLLFHATFSGPRQKLALIEKYGHGFAGSDALSRLIWDMTRERRQQVLEALSSFADARWHVKERRPVFPKIPDYSASWSKGANYVMGAHDVPPLIALPVMAEHRHNPKVYYGPTFTGNDRPEYELPERLEKRLNDITTDAMRNRSGVYSCGSLHDRFVGLTARNVNAALIGLMRKQDAFAKRFGASAWKGLRDGDTSASQPAEDGGLKLRPGMLPGSEIGHSFDNGDAHNGAFHIRFADEPNAKGEIPVRLTIVDSLTEEQARQRRPLQHEAYETVFPEIVRFFLELHAPEGVRFAVEPEVIYSGLQFCGYCTTHGELAAERIPSPTDGRNDFVREDYATELGRFNTRLLRARDLISTCALLRALLPKHELEKVRSGLRDLVDHVATDGRNLLVYAYPDHHYRNPLPPKANGEAPPPAFESVRITEKEYEALKPHMGPGVADAVKDGPVAREYRELLRARKAADDKMALSNQNRPSWWARRAAR